MSVKRTVIVSTFALAPATSTGQELFDLVHPRMGVAQDEQVLVAGEDDELGIGDVLGQVPTSTQLD
jgi:hypothetical protein